jgi:hypothetical protein
LACHQRAFRFFGGVPERVIIDNAKCAITRASREDPEVQRSYYEMAESYGFKIEPCPPREPQKKGRVEAGVKYVKRSFLPGREFASLEAANEELIAWVLEEAGNRIHGTTRERPLNQFMAIEKELLRPLPEPAFEPAHWQKLKLHRDCHVRFEKTFYSAPWTLIGQHLWVRATATMVQIFHQHELVATHVRCDGAEKPRTVNDHLSPEARAHLRQSPEWCQAEAERIGPECAFLVETLLSDRVLERLPSVRSLLKLEKPYGAQRLETACRRAREHEELAYRTVKTILARGIDALPEPERTEPEALPPAYTGEGRFGRDARDLLAETVEVAS